MEVEGPRQNIHLVEKEIKIFPASFKTSFGVQPKSLNVMVYYNSVSLDYNQGQAIKITSTESVRDLDSQCEMIIFESILTTFEASAIFDAAGAVVEISSSLQITNCDQVKLVQILDTRCIRHMFVKLGSFFQPSSLRFYVSPPPCVYIFTLT